jgi:hypothetical protein
MAGSGREWVMALDIRSTVAVAIRTRIIVHIEKGIATCSAGVEGTVQQGVAADIRAIANSPDVVDFSIKIVKIVKKVDTGIRMMPVQTEMVAVMVGVMLLGVAAVRSNLLRMFLLEQHPKGGHQRRLESEKRLRIFSPPRKSAFVLAFWRAR